MKKILILCVILTLSCRPKDYYPPDLYKWVNNYMVAIKSSDIERLLPLFSEDIRYYPPNQPALSGRENLSSWFLEYFNYYKNLSERLSIKEIKVSGDFAYLTCNYTVAGIISPSNEEFRDSGKLIYFFKQHFNGTWICTHAMWNNNNRTLDLHAEIPANFSGHWRLDLSRSTNITDILSAKVFIVQNGNEISINRFHEKTDKNIIESSSKYIIGKELKSFIDTGSFTTKAYWNPDKQSFTTVETVQSDKNGIVQKYTRKTIYSITAKGETLNVISEDILPEGSLKPIKDRHIEMIYNRL
jgi:ketosteroid isomerase-like protein